MLLIFSLYGFYKHVHITVLSFVCLWDLVLLFFSCVYFHTQSSHLTGHLCFLSYALVLSDSEAIAEEKRKTKRKKSDS